MYLKGSKWNMVRRTRRRSSPWRWLGGFVLIGAALLYIDRFIIPTTPAFIVPTATPTRNPESFLNEGQENFSKGKLLPAIQSYQQAIRSDPKNQALYVELAKVQIWAGQYSDALESAERSLVGNEEFSTGYALRGWALNFLENYEEAESSLRTAIEIDPNNSLAHAFLAETLINKDDYGDLDEAIAESNLAIQQTPNLLETVRARGFVLLNTGNYQEAINFYQRAITMNKYIPDLHLNLAYSYKFLMFENPEYVDLAIDAFLQANALNPDNSIPDLELSRLFLQLGEYAKAIQWAENAVKDEPTNPLRYGNLGRMYYEYDEFNQAIQFLRLAIRGGTAEDGSSVEGLSMTQENSLYFWYYGFALAKVTPNQCSEAVPIFQSLITTLPDYEYAVVNGTAGLELCSAAPEEVETTAEESTP